MLNNKIEKLIKMTKEKNINWKRINDNFIFGESLNYHLHNNNIKNKIKDYLTVNNLLKKAIDIYDLENSYFAKVKIGYILLVVVKITTTSRKYKLIIKDNLNNFDDYDTLNSIFDYQIDLGRLYNIISKSTNERIDNFFDEM